MKKASLTSYHGQELGTRRKISIIMVGGNEAWSENHLGFENINIFRQKQCRKNIYIPLDDLEPDNIPLNQTFRREKQLASQVRRKRMSTYVHPVYVHKLEGNEAWSEALRVLLFHQNGKSLEPANIPLKTPPSLPHSEKWEP